MGKKKFTPEQIVSTLREAEVLLGKGQNIAETCRGLGITEQTMPGIDVVKPVG